METKIQAKQVKITLIEALDVFQDYGEEIITAVKININDDMKQEKKDMECLGVSLIADEVRRLRMDMLFAARMKALKRMSYWYESLVGLRAKNEAKGHIQDADIERAREYPLQELYDGTLRRSSRKLQGTCPFHDEKTASFFIFPDNHFHCFGCHAHGDSIAFYMKSRNVDFIEAVKWLSNKI